MQGTIRITNRSPGLRSRTEPDPVMDVAFTDRDPLQVIAFLESTLAVFRARVESKMDKPVPSDDEEEDDEDELDP